MSKVEYQFFTMSEPCQKVRQYMGDFQRLKRPRLLLNKQVAIVISGVIAGTLITFHRFAAVASPRYNTTVTVADEAGTT